jgi:uncharacterized protein YbaR (Trm112 family)
MVFPASEHAPCCAREPEQAEAFVTPCPGVTLCIDMAISKDLLEILVCPLCKAPLELKQDENGLKCVECKRVYPIRDDIPVMLVDEARIEE